MNVKQYVEAEIAAYEADPPTTMHGVGYLSALRFVLAFIEGQEERERAKSPGASITPDGKPHDLDQRQFFGRENVQPKPICKRPGCPKCREKRETIASANLDGEELLIVVTSKGIAAIPLNNI